MLSQWLWLLVLMAAVGIWFDMSRQRERALMAARRLCTAQGVQLLDETVGLHKVRLTRSEGQLRLVRYYRFEVSTTGNNREPGTLWLMNGRLIGAVGDWIQNAEPIPLSRFRSSE